MQNCSQTNSMHRGKIKVPKLLVVWKWSINCEIHIKKSYCLIIKEFVHRLDILRDYYY